MVKGVTDAFSKHLKEEDEPKGIKAHFHKDDSGVLTLSSVEAVFEKNVTVEVDKEESTLSKIGSTLSKLFSGSEDENANKTEEAVPEKDAKDEKTTGTDDKEKKPAENTTETNDKEKEERRRSKRKKEERRRSKRKKEEVRRRMKKK